MPLICEAPVHLHFTADHMKSHFGMMDLFCSKCKQGFTTPPVRQRHENNCRKASSPSTELKDDDASTKYQLPEEGPVSDSEWCPAVDDAQAIKEEAREHAKLLATFKKAESIYLDAKRQYDSALAALSAEKDTLEAIRE